MKELFDKSLIANFKTKPTLLLHSCCAPCSSSVLEALCEYFDVTVLYYNPNIFPETEFLKRQREQERFCKEFMPEKHIKFTTLPYDEKEFSNCIKNLENEPEGGKRCTECFTLRLETSAKYAKENNFDFFTTTLSVSPLKDAKRLNSIGTSLGEKYGVRYLVSDFKKKEGYKRSCEISKNFNMYRQDFCGCKYSLAQRIMDSKGFIFDLDGTLLDSMGFYEDFSKNLVLHYGKVPSPQIREDVRSMTVEIACTYLCETYKLPVSPDEAFEYATKKVRELYEEKANLKPGVQEFLEYAKKKGIKMCIATASQKDEVILALKRLGIFDMFEFVLTCPELGTTKREPYIYDECCARMGLPKKNVTVFEDAHHTMKTAWDNQYRVVGVREETELNFMDEILENCHIYVESLSDLIHRENLR